MADAEELDRAAVVSQKSSRHLISVVLPAPFTPASPKHRPALDVEDQIRAALRRAEALAHSAEAQSDGSARSCSWSWLVRGSSDGADASVKVWCGRVAAGPSREAAQLPRIARRDASQCLGPR